MTRPFPFKIAFSDLVNHSMADLLNQYGLIHVYDTPKLTADQYHQWGEQIGKLLIGHRHLANAEGTVHDISSGAALQDKSLPWHNDYSYGRGDYFGSALYNVENGHMCDTEFADMTIIPEEIKAVYRGVIASHRIPDSFTQEFTDREREILDRRYAKHPLVSVHPNGMETVYCSPASIVDDIDIAPIVDWSERHSYVHKWVDGDLLFWDNRQLMHRRGPLLGPRRMWRIQFIL